jgi:urease accessory protein
VIIHPPGGIAGGDRLTLEVDLERNSNVLVTTPAATKWYKAINRLSSQQITIRVGDGATLDWLPQENIFFNAARAEITLTLQVAPSATVIGWEVLLLGRQLSGERWEEGNLSLVTVIRGGNGKLLWAEQTLLEATSLVRQAGQGLDGRNIFGLLWVVGSCCTPELAQEIAADLPFADELRAGATCLRSGVLLVRVLSRQIEPLRKLLVSCWNQLRPRVHGFQSQPLRLWST